MEKNGKVTTDPLPEHHHLIAAVEQVLHHRLTEHLAEVEHRMAGQVREAVNTGRRQIGHAVDVCTPAWLRPTEGEPRWPVAVAVLTAIGLQLAVPKQLAISPRWLLPGLEAAIMVMLNDGFTPGLGATIDSLIQAKSQETTAGAQLTAQPTATPTGVVAATTPEPLPTPVPTATPLATAVPTVAPTVDPATGLAPAPQG